MLLLLTLSQVLVILVAFCAKFDLTYTPIILLHLAIFKPYKESINVQFCVKILLNFLHADETGQAN